MIVISIANFFLMMFYYEVISLRQLQTFRIISLSSSLVEKLLYFQKNIHIQIFYDKVISLKIKVSSS